jgi:L-amino acid N-acyltransferase YncA
MTSANRLPVGVRLVPLTEDDVGAVLRIFNRHVSEGFAAYPEEPVSEGFVAELLGSASGYPALAAKAPNGELLGFGLLRPYSPGPTFSQTAVTTIFLAPDQTGRGIGTALLHRTLDEAKKTGITRILAHISSRNPGSIAFHRKHGFAECGRFPGIGRKWGERFDVVWMIRTLERPDDA